MRKLVNLLYTIIIPIIPLGLHVFINLLTNTSVELEYVYPELFFATISICIESFKTLQAELKYNNTKPLILFMLLIIFIISSVSYGSILVIDNLSLDIVNIKIALYTSFVIFSSSILLHIATIIFREA